MGIVANTTTHPALVLRHAVDTITTELVRAPITPTYLTVGTYSSGTKVDGGMAPRCGCCQRSSASAPTIAPVRRSTSGW